MATEPVPLKEIGGANVLFHVSVCLPGHQSSISPVVQGLMELVRENPCGAEGDFEIETALREALANAVVHGCGNDGSKVVVCTLWCRRSGEMTIVVRDPGPGFDPSSVPDPSMGENVYSTHGRGIYLIRRVMDDVWFERGGREIHMVLGKRRSRSV